jgi:hypothetical protein
MDLKEKQTENIQLLIEHELAMQQLYLAYAKQLAGYEDFWHQLADEESKHADVIRRFKKEVETGNVCLKPERFHTAAIERSMRYIFDLQEQAESGDIDLNKALSEAFHIEDAMIEHKFFEAFDGDSAELRQALRILLEATMTHRQRVKRALDESRRI